MMLKGFVVGVVLMAFPFFAFSLYAAAEGCFRLMTRNHAKRKHPRWFKEEREA